MRLLLGALLLLLCCLGGCDDRWDDTVPPTPPAADSGTCDDAIFHPDDCEWPSPAPGAREVQLCGAPDTTHTALCYMVDSGYQPIVARTNCWLGGYYCVAAC